MASRTLAIASSRVCPWLTQPGIEGHSATHAPSSSRPNVITNFMRLILLVFIVLEKLSLQPDIQWRAGPHAFLSFRLLFRPSVFEGYGAVEDWLAWFGVAGVDAEVGEALELVTGCRVGLRHAGFEFRGEDFEGVWVQVLFEIAAFAVGFFDGEEAVVEAHFGVDRVPRADPMDRALHFSAGGRAASL